MRNPPWDIRTEFLVLNPETLQQSGLLVDENKAIESQPNCNTVSKNRDAAEMSMAAKEEAKIAAMLGPLSA